MEWNGLDEIRRDAEILRVDQVSPPLIGRHHHHRRRIRRLSDFFEHQETRPGWEHHVEHDAIRSLSKKQRNRGITISGKDDLSPLRLEGQRCRIQNVLVIVDHENALAGKSSIVGHQETLPSERSWSMVGWSIQGSPSSLVRIEAGISLPWRSHFGRLFHRR